MLTNRISQHMQTLIIEHFNNTADATFGSTAAQLGVSVASVRRVIRDSRGEAEAEPPQRRERRKKKVDLDWLRARVLAEPEARLKDHADAYERERGQSVSLSTVHFALQAIGAKPASELKPARQRKSKVDPDWMRAQVRAFPRARLKDHAEAFQREHGLFVSLTTIHFAIRAIGIKKKTYDSRLDGPCKGKVDLDWMRSRFDANPQARLKEHAEAYFEERGIRVSLTTIHLALVAVGAVKKQTDKHPVRIRRSKVDLEWLRARVAANPNARLRDHAQAFQNEHGVYISLATIYTALQTIGATRKQRTRLTASEPQDE